MTEPIIIAGIGGFIGSCCRYLTGILSKKIFGDSFPAGTLIVNVVGCFLIGIIFGLWEKIAISETMNIFLATGFCGGFTTFSSFSYETYSQLQKRQFVKFAAYTALTVCLGMLMIWLGMRCN